MNHKKAAHNPQRNQNTTKNLKAPQNRTTQDVETTNNNVEQHIDKHLPMWRKNHYYRRSEYKRHYMSKEKIKVIQEHISQKYIPRRFRPRQTHTKSEYNLEEKHSVSTMKHEIEKFQFHSDTARGNFESTDQDMFDRIDIIPDLSDFDKNKMKEMWVTEVSNAVNKAHELCEYNLIYLRNLPTKEPYTGFTGLTNTHNSDSRTRHSSIHTSQQYNYNRGGFH